MGEERIAGTLAAAATPLCESGQRLDEEALGPLLDFYCRSGIDGVLVLGTTGEGILLDHDERCRVAERAVVEARDIRVLVHCGAQITRATCALAAHAAEIGADGVAVIAPPYFRFDVHELVEHFAAAARACAPLPFYVYEYAERAGYPIPIAVIERLQDQLSNLVGMKVSDAPFELVEPYLATGLDVFIGAEELIPRGLAGGAVGAVSGVAAAFPEAVADLVREPTDERAEHVAALRASLSVHPFQASIKMALGLRGLPVHPDVRAPLLPLQTAAAEDLRRRLEQLAAVEAR